LECPFDLGIYCIEKEFEDHIRYEEGFLDCPIPDSFPRVLVFHFKCFQSSRKLICMLGASYSRCEVDFCMAFQPLFSRLLRSSMKPKCELYIVRLSPFSFSWPSLHWCPLLWWILGNRQFFFLCRRLAQLGLREMKASTSLSSHSMLGHVVFLYIYIEFGSILSLAWWQNHV